MFRIQVGDREFVLESSGSGLVFRVQDSGFMYMGSELKVRCHV